MNFIYRIPTKEEIERYKTSQEYNIKNNVQINKQEFVKSLSPYLNMYNEEWEYSPNDLSYMKNVVRNKQMKLVGIYRNEETNFIDFLVNNEIAPEIALDTDNNCSIGFSNKTNKWYGWSHRAMQSFDIGHTIKKGDLGYTSDNIDDLYQSFLEWHQNDKEYTRLMKFNNYITVETLGSFIEGLTKDGDYVCRQGWSNLGKIYPGKGEWTAKTLEDCKQMAIDFAIAVR